MDENLIVNKTPILSVLLPVYNCESYISLAIESILNQTFRNFEFIIINDGSTDKSQEIIESYNDERIKLINKQNSGLIDTLNLGLKECRGTWIARMDADDISLPNRFEEQIRHLNENIGLLGTQITYINEVGVKTGESKLPTKNDDIIKSLYKGVNVIIHPTVIVKKDIIQKVGGYSKLMKHTEDYDLWLRISKLCNFHNLDENLFLLRKHHNNISNLQFKEAYINAIICRNYYYKSNKYTPIEEYEYRQIREKVESAIEKYKFEELFKKYLSYNQKISTLNILQKFLYSLQNLKSIFSYILLKFFLKKAFNGTLY